MSSFRGGHYTHTAVDRETIEPLDRLESIGLFLFQWIEFEKLIRQVTPPDPTWPKLFVPSTKMLKSLNVSATTLREIDNIGRLRNNLVHGIENPNPSDMVDAAQRLKIISQEIKARHQEVKYAG